MRAFSRYFGKRSCEADSPVLPQVENYVPGAAGLFVSALRTSSLTRPRARTGKLAEMGFGYEDCKALNSKLIYASVSGALLASHLPARRRALTFLRAQVTASPARTRATRATTSTCESSHVPSHSRVSLTWPGCSQRGGGGTDAHHGRTRRASR